MHIRYKGVEGVSPRGVGPQKLGSSWSCQCNLFDPWLLVSLSGGITHVSRFLHNVLLTTVLLMTHDYCVMTTYDSWLLCHDCSRFITSVSWLLMAHDDYCLMTTQDSLLLCHDYLWLMTTVSYLLKIHYYCLMTTYDSWLLFHDYSRFITTVSWLLMTHDFFVMTTQDSLLLSLDYSWLRTTVSWPLKIHYYCLMTTHVSWLLCHDYSRCITTVSWLLMTHDYCPYLEDLVLSAGLSIKDSRLHKQNMVSTVHCQCSVDQCRPHAMWQMTHVIVF